MTDYGKPHREALIEGEPVRESPVDIFASLVVFAVIFLVLGFIGGICAAANLLL